MDVVLIDTAGRMQDNEPLMRALGKVSSRAVAGRGSLVCLGGGGGDFS